MQPGDPLFDNRMPELLVPFSSRHSEEISQPSSGILIDTPEEQLDSLMNEKDSVDSVEHLSVDAAELGGLFSAFNAAMLELEEHEPVLTMALEDFTDQTQPRRHRERSGQ